MRNAEKVRYFVQTEELLPITRFFQIIYHFNLFLYIVLTQKPHNKKNARCLLKDSFFF